MKFDIYRRYRQKPYQKWACTVVEDDDAEQGYRVIRHDHEVADAAFLHQIDQALVVPSYVVRGGTPLDVEGVPSAHADGPEIVHRGDPGYMHAALRNASGFYIGPPPKT